MLYTGPVREMQIIFGEILSRKATRVYWHHTSDYSSDVSAPLMGWRPGQLIGWAAPCATLVV